MRRDAPGQVDEPPRHTNGRLTGRGRVALGDALPEAHFRRRDTVTQQLPGRHLPTREPRLDRDLTHEPDPTDNRQGVMSNRASSNASAACCGSPVFA